MINKIYAEFTMTHNCKDYETAATNKDYNDCRHYIESLIEIEQKNQKTLSIYSESPVATLCPERSPLRLSLLRIQIKKYLFPGLQNTYKRPLIDEER
jgi:hypothetical protein